MTTARDPVISAIDDDEDEQPRQTAVLRRLDSVAPEPVTWQWPGRLARGKLTLVVGEPAAGKGYVMAELAARSTTGPMWPDGLETGGPEDVLILTSEDGIADTIRPRVDRQGGDPRRVHILQAVHTAGVEAPFALDVNLPALEDALGRTKARQAWIDPLSAYLGRAARGSHHDAEIRGVLTPLAALADRCDIALVGILHLTKDQVRRLLHRVQGSVAFVAQARIVLAVGEDPEQPGRRLFVGVKNNLGPKASPLAFRISDAGLTWDSDAPVESDADRLLAGYEPTTRTERRALETAAQFLRDALAEAPLPSKQLEADAKANGIAQRTLWRAKDELGVKANQAATQSGRRCWYWRLPMPEEFP